MKKLLMILSVAAFLASPMAAGFAQTTDTRDARDVGGRMNYDKPDFKTYSFEQKSDLIDHLKTKKERIDEKIKDINRSDEMSEVKKQKIERAKERKREIDNLISRVKAARAEDWDRVRTDVGDEFNRLDMNF